MILAKSPVALIVTEVSLFIVNFPSVTEAVTPISCRLISNAISFKVLPFVLISVPEPICTVPPITVSKPVSFVAAPCCIVISFVVAVCKLSPFVVVLAVTV